jgi:serine-type D-Ala-D-Ala carboxypeptidase/endopeptidase (penicillin-binding protein 4)
MRRAAALVLACLFAALPAAAREVPATVRAALRAAGIPSSAVALRVEALPDGKPLVSQNADAPMNPASVMKLVTSFAALDLLGPAFTFHTDFAATGEIRAGVLDGDLVIRGGGDPKLTYERLWQAAHRLRARGLREIRGDVVVDRGYFAPAAHDAAQFDNEPRRAYNVGPDAALVNFHAIDFHFIPAAQGVRVVAEPDLPNVEIVTRIHATEGACGAWRHKLHYDVEENGLIATVVFSGEFAASCGERAWPLSIFDGPGFFESVFRWVWNESGGVLRGKVRSGTVPPTARLLYRDESEPLASLLRDMNKFSNNVMARHLFLALSAERSSAGGDAASSARLVRECLAAHGIAAPELTLENGSGLSRDERASAATIAAVLRHAWSSGVMPELAASLPVFAVDGTFKDRRAVDAGGQAHLKGGTLTGVQSMAGYVLDRNGKRWVVVMIVNHPNAGAAQPALDALVEWVHDYAR